MGLSELVGCSPTFNWREVRPAQTALKIMFPCKPELTVRSVTLAGQEVAMTMLSCVTGGATFSLTYADMSDTKGLDSTLVNWQQATLGNMRVASVKDVAFMFKGANVASQTAKVTAQGARLDGTGMSIEAIWFAFGTQVFQAVVTGNANNTDVSETFFSGITTP